MTCPVGHINKQYRLSDSDFHLSRDVGQVLMSTLVDVHNHGSL